MKITKRQLRKLVRKTLSEGMYQRAADALMDLAGMTDPDASLDAFEDAGNEETKLVEIEEMKQEVRETNVWMTRLVENLSKGQSTPLPEKNLLFSQKHMKIPTGYMNALYYIEGSQSGGEVSSADDVVGIVVDLKSSEMTMEYSPIDVLSLETIYSMYVKFANDLGVKPVALPREI